jgi:hypothetical protein
LGNLVHENFISGVQPFLEHMGPTLSLFNLAGPGEFDLTGEKVVYAADVTYSGGALGTSGWLPDSEYVDPENLETTPVRTYVRRAVDNFIVARAQGTDGAFEDFLGRVMEQLWDAFERMQNRHVHGSSDGTIALCSSRTSQTVFVAKDGYGHTGTSPTMFLEPGMRLAWLDASNSFAVGGTAIISTIAYDTATITMATNFDDGVTTIAAGDPIVFVTTPDSTATYFDTERSNAPLGLMDHIDPDESSSTYLGLDESTVPRHKPIRTASANFDEVELMEFWKEIESKSQSYVSPATHVNTLQPGMLIELAKSLLPYTQIMEKGRDLEGGWQTVRIAGHDFLEDPYHLHDVMYCLCVEDLRVIDLDGDARISTDDGREWQRLADFDGREVFARHYLQRLMKRRNRSGALTGVANTNASRYTPDPNY